MRDVCRLCHEERELVRSHIVPEFVWKKTYGPDGATTSVPREDRPLRVLRKGLRERLLCERCERIIKRYEDYFARVWFQDYPLPAEIPAGTNGAKLDGLDYHTFKLFHLSVLWRTHCARGPEFAEISLAARHETRLRQMLFEGNAGRQAEYPVLASLVLRPDGREIVKTLIGAPSASRIAGHWVYTTIYAGCAWSIVVSSHGLEWNTTNRLSEDGSLVMHALDLRRFPKVYEILIARRDQARELRRRRLARGPR